MEYEGIRFDTVSSTCLIQYYCKIGKITECLKLVESMVIKGPPPDTITFNTLLSGLCKNRLLGMAEKMFNYFKGIGVSPNTTTYNILMRASIRDGNDLLSAADNNIVDGIHLSLPTLSVHAVFLVFFPGFMFIEHSMPACTINGLWIWPEVSYAFYVLCDLSVSWVCLAGISEDYGLYFPPFLLKFCTFLSRVVIAVANIKRHAGSALWPSHLSDIPIPSFDN
ncbi:hypothetical protein Sango_2226900 [Sesamum angolense]|uniref:Pentatricopeptide repeat-containing protein n=1 Tax=Sesamum angolense TaxID=2727404 RepID=A0AAE1W8V6_9LAMI|nr:hypothetical protein Sango_2226900 [Sesamum angolense]